MGARRVDEPNIATWLGNRELDVVVEDETFAREMEEMYLDDLRNATAVVLHGTRVRAPGAPPPRRREPMTSGGGSGGRVAAPLASAIRGRR